MRLRRGAVERPGRARADERPTVLYTHPSSELYGSDRMAAVTVGALARHFPTELTIPTSGPLVELMTAEGVVPVDNPVAVLRKGDLTAARLPRALVDHVVGLVRAVRHVRRSRCSVVYVNTITQPAWIVAGRLLGRRVVCHVRENEENLPRAIRFVLVLPLLLAHVVVANSHATARFVTDQLPALRRSTTVVHNGKDWSPYFRSGFAMSAPGVRLLVSGRLSPRKGQDVALGALAALVRDGVDARMVLAGDTFTGYESYRDTLDRAAADASIAGRVHFAGFRTDVASLLEEADIVIVPSRIEPFGTVALEAMAAQRVVVASNVQGLAEIVDDGETGYLVTPGDPDDLARRLRSIVDDPDAARRVARAGYAHVNDVYSALAYERRVVDLVGSAAGTKVVAT